MGMILNLKKHLFIVLTFTFFISLSFFSSCVFAQDNYRGLISESYMQITDNGKVVKTNKPVIIIYNRNYCSLYIGDKTSHFPVESYTTRIKEGNIEEARRHVHPNVFEALENNNPYTNPECDKKGGYRRYTRKVHKKLN